MSIIIPNPGTVAKARAARLESERLIEEARQRGLAQRPRLAYSTYTGKPARKDES